ncbi:unnamed protein product, partial [Amoebophrya sp. A25]
LASIYLNTQFPKDTTLQKVWKDSDLRLAADGAGARLAKRGLVPDLVVGDLDSLGCSDNVTENKNNDAHDTGAQQGGERETLLLRLLAKERGKLSMKAWRERLKEQARTTASSSFTNTNVVDRNNSALLLEALEWTLRKSGQQLEQQIENEEMVVFPSSDRISVAAVSTTRHATGENSTFGGSTRLCTIIHNPDQTTTDLEKALAFVNRENFEGIQIIGKFAGSGGRLDHFFALCHTLYKEALYDEEQRRPSSWYTPMVCTSDHDCLMCCLPSGETIIPLPLPVQPEATSTRSSLKTTTSSSSSKSNIHDTLRVGLIPLGGLPVATTEGLRWNLNGTPLGFGGVVSSCNQLAEDATEVRIRTSHPILWTQSRVF